MNTTPTPLAGADHTPHPFAQKIAATLARPERMGGEKFRAWHGSGDEIDVTAAENLPEAVSLALLESSHKGRFTVEQTKDRRRYLHFYGVKKSTTNGTYRENAENRYLRRVFEGRLYEEHFLTQQILTPHAPVAPWRWTSEDYMGERHGICPDLEHGPLIVLADLPGRASA